LAAINATQKDIDALKEVQRLFLAAIDQNDLKAESTITISFILKLEE
jgi:hypothetical protein